MKVFFCISFVFLALSQNNYVSSIEVQNDCSSYMMDIVGNIYVRTEDGVNIFNSQGKFVGKIRMAKASANATFGGIGNQASFICSSDSMWAFQE